MKLIIAQIIGFIALVYTCVSIQQNKKIRVLVYQMIANFLYFLQYIFLDALSGACTSFLGLMRYIVYYQYEKNNKEKSIFILFLFSAIAIIIGVFTYNGVISLLPPITALMYTYGTWQNNLKRFRIIAVIVPICWFVYNFFVGAYVGMISTVIEFSSAVIAIYRLDIRKKERKNE